MKRLSVIGRIARYHMLLAALYLVCSARSCEEGPEAERAAAEASRDSLATALAAAPGPDALHSYETIALEQLRDYAGYRAIALDPAGDSIIRQKAGEMAARLAAPGVPGPDIHSIPDSVWIERPLAPAGDSAWAGVIGYAAGAERGTAGFQLQRIRKCIGEDTLRVWGVVLFESFVVK